MKIISPRNIWSSHLRNIPLLRKAATYINVLFRMDQASRHKSEIFDKFYSLDNPKLNCKKKVVILMIDGKTLHGGLSDRIRGIIFGYMASRESGVEFRVNFATPFRLENYLEPNQYNWLIDESEVSFNSDESEPVYLHSAFDKQYESRLNFNYLKRRISKSTKQQIHLYSNIIYTAGGKYTKSFHELFKPSRIVQQDIDAHSSAIGDSYINATFRFQNSLGDFKELNSQPLSDDEQEKLIQSCIDQLIKLHESNQGVRILVTADSAKFLERVSHFEFVYVIKGDLVHMSFTDNQSIDTHKKSFVDYMMIAKASKIYLMCTDHMYRSGFPQSASLIYNRPFEVIEF